MRINIIFECDFFFLVLISRNKMLNQTDLNEKNNKFIVYASIVMILSLLFNSFTIYEYKRMSNKISAHYICMNVCLVNIMFSLVVLPFFMMKKSHILDNNSK